MVINGKPRQACTALIDHLEQPIRLEPMRTFPVIRDLIVDRSRMFDALEAGEGLDSRSTAPMIWGRVRACRRRSVRCATSCPSA